MPSHELKLGTYSLKVTPLSETSWTTDLEKYVPETGDGFEAYPYWWNLAFFPDLKPGAISLWSDDKLIPLVGSWAIFLPSCAILNWRLGTTPFYTRIVASTVALPKRFSGYGFAFECPLEEIRCEQEAVDLLDEASATVTLRYSTKQNAVARRAKAFLDKNYMNEIQIHDIAEKLRFSRGVMSRMFSQMYGISPVEYRNKLRISQAMFHLMFGNETLAEVAEHVGFQNANSFQKRFRKVVLSAPNQYQFAKQSQDWKEAFRKCGAMVHPPSIYH